MVAERSPATVSTIMTRPTDLARLALAAGASALLALWAFPRAIEDWRFQLAGLANWFFGRPAPAATLLLGFIVTFIAVIATVDARRRGRHIASILLAPLAVGWLAYAAGSGLVLASGGQTIYPGRLHYTFTGSIDHAEVLTATCRTPVGQRAVLADVDPAVESPVAVGGLPVIGLRHPATGEPIPGGPEVERFDISPADGTVISPFTIPSLGARPLPYMEVIADPGRVEREPPIGFMHAYDYVLESFEDAGMAGSAVLAARRWTALDEGEVRWVNLTIPDDPWPETFTLTIAWTCAV